MRRWLAFLICPALRDEVAARGPIAADAIEGWLSFAPEMLSAVECWRIVEELRADEGDSIELVHDNPDFGAPPNMDSVVIFTTNFTVETRFYGDNIREALRAALAAKKGRPAGA